MDKLAAVVSGIDKGKPLTRITSTEPERASGFCRRLVPNILLDGQMGIAVGASEYYHNLGEVVDATVIDR